MGVAAGQASHRPRGRRQAVSGLRQDQYVPLFEFDTAGVRNAFSQAAIAAVLDLHPDAFEQQAVSA